MSDERYFLLGGFGSEHENISQSSSNEKLGKPSDPVSGSDQKPEIEPKTENEQKIAPPPSPDEFDNSLEFEIAVLERDVEYFYGWGRFRPASLQWCRSPYFVLTALCLAQITQSFGILGVFPAAAHHLQLGFHLSPMQLGRIRMMYDIGALIMIGPVIFFGVQGANRPIWIGTGMFGVGLAALLFVLPQCVVDQYSNQSLNLCNPTATSDSECAQESKFAVTFFMLGSLLYGIGATPTAIMGLTYLDENVPASMSAVFTGLCMFCVMFGAMLGNVVTGYILRIDDHNNSPQQEEVNPSGSWWIGMVMTTIMTWMSAVIILGFPHRLPGAMRAQMGEMGKRFTRKWFRNEDSDNSSAGNASIVPSVRRVLRRCKRVVLNPAYVGIVVDSCAFNFFVTAFAFMPLYIHLVMHESTAKAAHWSAVLVGIGILCLITGVGVQRILYLGVKGNIRLSLIASVAYLVFNAVFLIHCSASSMAGPDRYPIYRHDNFTKSPNVNVPCNAKCNCTQDHFEPVCYNQFRQPTTTGQKHRHIGVVIFSGCYAGCKNRSKTNYFDCECVPDHPKREQDNSEYVSGGMVEKGVCPLSKHEESLIHAFIVGMCWVTLCMFIRANAVRQSLLHCVRFKDRVISLAIAFACGKLLGSVPASPILGKLFSNACKLSVQRCGKDFGCVWADSYQLMTRMLATGYVVGVFSSIGLLVALLTYKEPVESESAWPTRKDDESEDLVTAEPV